MPSFLPGYAHQRQSQTALTGKPWWGPWMPFISSFGTKSGICCCVCASIPCRPQKLTEDRESFEEDRDTLLPTLLEPHRVCCEFSGEEEVRGGLLCESSPSIRTASWNTYKGELSIGGRAGHCSSGGVVNISVH